MTRASADIFVADQNEPLEAEPYPLAVCWAIWISCSAGLWWSAWRIAAFFL